MATGWRAASRRRAATRSRSTYGTLYPSLLKLDQQGFIIGHWGESENSRRAKFYALTPAGRKQLAREAREWHETAALMAAFLAGKREAT